MFLRQLLLRSLLLVVGPLAVYVAADHPLPGSRCHQRRFDDGSVSVERCTVEHGAVERVRAFSRAGVEIGRWDLLRRPRTDSLHLTFFANGAVRVARYSHQPDGGIQWYQATTTYDQDGNVTSFREDGHEFRQILTR